MPEPGYPQGRPLLSRVGTGEGAQAYGHGFYSAEAKGVAKSYKDDLGGFDQLTLHTKAGKKAGDALDDVDLEVAKYLEVGAKDAGQFPHNTVYYAKQNAEKAGDKAALKRLDEYGPDARMSYERNYGSLKKLDIPDEDIAKFLDWDAPLSEQPKAVQTLVENTRLTPAQKGQITRRVKEIDNESALPNADIPTLAIERDRLVKTYNEAKTGRELYEQIEVELGSQEAASEALRKVGIPGLKYYDQMSRGQKNWVARHPQGGTWEFPTKAEAVAHIKRNPEKTLEPPEHDTRNYVTWDQDVLNRTKILESGGETVGLLKKPRK
jgi:hypothetical protein